MNRRYWLIPPLLALAGYFSADAVLGVRETQAVEASAKTSLRQDARPHFTVEQALDSYSEQIPRGPDPLESASVDELKQRILDLQQTISKLEGDGVRYSPEGRYYEEERWKAVHELVERSGRAGCEWIDASAPELRLIAIDAWASEDPQAAWAAICNSKRLPPCDISTVMRLLNDMGKADPTRLRQACGELPWHLFRYCDFYHMAQRAEDRPKVSSIALDYLDETSFWVESGAALFLAEQGIHLERFFENWSRKDPVSAFRAWSEWPPSDGHDADFVTMLSRDASKFEVRDEIIAIMESYPPELKARAAAAVKKTHRSRHDSDLSIYYPVLGLPVAAEAE